MFVIRKKSCETLSSDQRAQRKRDEDLMMIISTVIAVIMLFIGATSSMATPGPDRPMSSASVQSEMVYICDSKGATAYHHYKDCKLLGNCKAKVETVKEMSARGKGRDRCDSCNKRLKAAKK
jgi:hypothetical protein